MERSMQQTLARSTPTPDGADWSDTSRPRPLRTIGMNDVDEGSNGHFERKDQHEEILRRSGMCSD